MTYISVERGPGYIEEVKVAAFIVVKELYGQVTRYKVCGVDEDGTIISVPFIYGGNKLSESHAEQSCYALNKMDGLSIEVGSIEVERVA